jgi:hypothetical protein
MAQMNYIADTNDQYTGYDCLPAGEYKVQIVDSDIVPSKSGDAEMLKLIYEVIADPQFDGRKIFDNLIMDHRTSTDAVRIGKQKLNTICALTGVKSLKDSAQLHTKTLTLLVGIREYNGDKQNTIKKYLPFSGNNAATEDDDAPAQSRPKFVK